MTTDAYVWLLGRMGQLPFRPPSVAGWDWGPAWMCSGTVKARLDLANQMIGWRPDAPLYVPDGAGRPDIAPREQVQRALDALGARGSPTRRDACSPTSRPATSPT